MSPSIEGLEQLHSHSSFSLLDGLMSPDEGAERASKINQKYFCITDHGMMGAVPSQIRACDKHNLTPLFGCELYVNPMQFDMSVIPPTQTTADYLRANFSEADKEKFTEKSYHLLAIAYTNEGYENLVALSSWGWLHGFYKKPRVNHELLMKHKEGIIFSSCCYMGEIGQAFDRYGEDAAMQMVEKYMAMFGENFRLEIMLLDFKKQKPFDVFILKAHQKYGIPLIVTQDAHYACKEDSKYQRLMLMMQTGRTIAQVEQVQTEDGGEAFEMQDQNLWMKSEEELNQFWLEKYSDVIEYDYLAEAKRNTVRLCEKAKGVKLDRSIKLPKIPNDELVLKEEILKGVKKRKLPATDVYMSRIKEEYTLICQKGFASYFLITQKLTKEAARISPILLGYGDGSEACGPGRGSGVGSLVCYCIGITHVDPIRHDLLFSRFLSPARGGKSLKLKFNGMPLPSVPEE